MIFRHYKTKKLYEYIGEARHSETLEYMAIYKSMETGELWARPKVMFFGMVDAPNIDGGPQQVRRFEEVKSNEL